MTGVIVAMIWSSVQVLSALVFRAIRAFGYDVDRIRYTASRSKVGRLHARAMRSPDGEFRTARRANAAPLAHGGRYADSCELPRNGRDRRDRGSLCFRRNRRARSSSLASTRARADRKCAHSSRSAYPKTPPAPAERLSALRMGPRAPRLSRSLRALLACAGGAA